MRYYFYENYIDTGIYSGKYLRFEDLDTAPEQTNSVGWTTDKPDLFLPPYCPYWNGSDWAPKKGPQKYYTVSGRTNLSVLENSVYEFSSRIPSLTFDENSIFLRETSVFFTFDSSANHKVNFPQEAKVVGSQQYWVSGESYIITIYNGYYIIGVAKNRQ